MSRRRPWPRRRAPISVALIAFRVVSTLAVAALVFAPNSATAQAPQAGVKFDGGFEVGNLSQWSWGAQCANTGVPDDSVAVRGTVHLTKRLVGRGTYAARFNLPAAARNNACEVLAVRNIGLGTDDYYGLMVFFPKNSREPSPAGWGLSIAQFSFQGIPGAGAPVSLNAHVRNIRLVIQTGL